jgi:hypothetical protein
MLKRVEEGFSVTHENENIYFGNRKIYSKSREADEVQL